jgi:hypothetical protein
MSWVVARAISSARWGVTLARAIRAGMIHGRYVTGANCEGSPLRPATAMNPRSTDAPKCERCADVG